MSKFILEYLDAAGMKELRYQDAGDALKHHQLNLPKPNGNQHIPLGDGKEIHSPWWLKLTSKVAMETHLFPEEENESESTTNSRLLQTCENGTVTEPYQQQLFIYFAN